MNGKKLDKEFILDDIIYTTQKHPKSSCGFCYGRGFMGTNSKTNKKIPCRCLGLIMQTGKVESKVEILKDCIPQDIRGDFKNES